MRPRIPALPDEARRPATLAAGVLALCVCSFGAGRDSMRQEGLALAALQSGYIGIAPTADHASAWGAGADPTPGTAAEPSRHRCQDAPPAAMPDDVRRWCTEIDAAADRWGLDPRALAILVALECPWGDPRCGERGSAQHNPVGARGLTQIMPGTAPEIARATGLACADGPDGVSLDPAISLACGAWYYVQRLIEAAPAWHAGDEAAHVAIAGAGYNGGPGRGATALATWRAGGHPCEAAIPRETRDYCRGFYDRWQLLTASPAPLDGTIGAAWRPRP